ncbi:hypothetical protein ABZX92_45365 [Lentzea sp. NPDC006480]|uniref:hypothetical protein n=1 Tax=Lentzea sp. NPDC006480 TaxID=3157176 RepID=UPI0033A731AE
MSLFDLKIQLDRDSWGWGEHEIVNCSQEISALTEKLRVAVSSRYRIRRDFQLNKMHEYFTEDQIAQHMEEPGLWFDTVSELGEAVVIEYHRFVQWLSAHLGLDLVFEADPPVRFHVPGLLDDKYRLENGEFFMYHSDTMVGDYFQEFNCWLPFCDAKASSTISLCSKQFSVATINSFASQFGYSYDEYKQGRGNFFEFMKDRPELIADLREDAMPINLRRGQLLVFDSRNLHSTVENVENTTRVSMDFRVMPVTAYRAIVRELSKLRKEPNAWDGKRFIMGEIFDSRTAGELFGA